MTASTSRRSAVLPVAFAVVAVILITAGALLLVRAHRLRTTGPVANHAVVDRARTTDVIGQVGSALNSVLSYDYRKPAVAQAAAKKWLTGDAPHQYAVLFAELRKLAPGQQLTLQAKVVNAGVTSMRGDTAQLLVFLDQQSTRTSDHKSSVSAAQVQITAVQHGSSWRITELKPL